MRRCDGDGDGDGNGVPHGPKSIEEASPLEERQATISTAINCCFRVFTTLTGEKMGSLVAPAGLEHADLMPPPWTDFTSRSGQAHS